MVDLTALREAVAERIKQDSDIPITNTYAFAPDTIITPCAIVYPGEPYVQYHGSFGSAGTATINLRVQIIYGRVSDKTSQRQHDEMASGPIANALEETTVSPTAGQPAGPNLGLASTNVQVTQVTAPVGVDIGEASFLLSEYALTVYQTRS